MEGLSINIALPQQSKVSAPEGNAANRRNETKERFKNKLKAIKKGIEPVKPPRKFIPRDTNEEGDYKPKLDGSYSQPRKEKPQIEGLHPRSKKISSFKQGYHQNANSDNRSDNTKFSKTKKNTKNSKEKSVPPVPLKDFSEVLQIDENKTQEGDVFTAEKFEELKKLHPFLVSVLEKNGFATMTKIQRESIPVLLKGKDSIIKSETGSGKTLAYLVPIINLLVKNEVKVERTHGAYAIVLCPTRELCIQVLNIANLLVQAFVNIVPGALMGGESIKKEKARLRKGINILITTPARLIYHFQNTNSFNYDKLKFVVFEESDRTLDMGFKKDLDQIIQTLSNKTNVESLQKILISASYTEKIEALWMKIAPGECEMVGFDRKEDTTENGEESKGEFMKYDDTFKLPAKLAHKYIVIEESKRISFLVSMVMFSMKTKIMIFVSTCDEVEFLEILFKNLEYDDYDEDGQKSTTKLISSEVFTLHGKIEQKKRTDTYFKFKKSKSGILICTDVGSRGLDFEEVRLIIQFDVPSSIVDYVNRMGRTARIDNYGMSLLFLFPSEKGYLDLLKEKAIVVEKYQDEDFYSYFEGKLKNERNIHIDAHSYIERILRKLIRSSDDYKYKARRTYVSFTRAYARLLPKEIFHPKKLNLHSLSKSFGLGSAAAANKETKSEEYSNALTPENISQKYAKLLEKRGEKRKITKTRTLERMEFEA